MDSPLVITLGDPAGIGPEIIAGAYAARAEHKLPPFCVIGDIAVLTEATKRHGSVISVANVSHVSDAAEHFETYLPCLSVPVSTSINPGVPSPDNGPSIIKCLETACQLAKAGAASAVVTAPVSKSILYHAGFDFPGQTEFFADRCDTQQYAMMLAGPNLKVVPATIHIPLSQVPSTLTAPLVEQTIRTTHAALKTDFGITTPRIAVTGLNPHAGEAGDIGTEDRDLIAPVIQALVAEGLGISGPHSADGLFHARARQGYDAVVAMYHDQALIPLKILNFDDGVNVTIGLPIVRTSPDHGTGFDIVGTGKARAGSMIAAIDLAGRIAARRARK